MQACLPVNKKIYPLISLHPCPQANLLLRFVLNCNFHKHCYIAASHSSYKSLRYKPLHLETLLKPLAKIQKPKAYKRQFKEFWLPKKSSTDASRIANSFEIYKNHLQ